jgi:hypothetical protein
VRKIQELKRKRERDRKRDIEERKRSKMVNNSSKAQHLSTGRTERERNNFCIMKKLFVA